MKFKLLLPALALCAGSLTVRSLFADDDFSTKGGARTLRPDAAMQASSMQLSQLLNAQVKDIQGNKVGQLEDFVIDPNSGRVQFAVVRLTGDIGPQGAYTPIPWPLVQQPIASASTVEEPRTVVLNVDRSKLQSVQKFSVNRWTAQTHPAWGSEVYSFYGVPWDSSTVSIGGTGSGTMQDPATRQGYYNPDRVGDRQTTKSVDNGTGPDGKDVFKLRPPPGPPHNKRMDRE